MVPICGCCRSFGLQHPFIFKKTILDARILPIAIDALLFNFEGLGGNYIFRGSYIIKFTKTANVKIYERVIYTVALLLILNGWIS
jgi:hypothetical protein